MHVARGMRARLGLGGQPGRQMHYGFADEFTGAFGKNHMGVSRAFGIFRHGHTKLLFDMCLQRFTYVDLLTTDLIAHLHSFI